MKRRILSIDFDYFIDTDINTRNDKFPDGVDEKPREVLDKEWEYFYNTYPEIKYIGVISSYDIMCHSLSKLTKGQVLISESHRDISQIFDRLSINDDLEVINYDFHHDNYISGGSEIDCANWVRHLMNIRPNTKFEWRHRIDSEITSLMGDFPYDKSLNEEIFTDIGGEFDYIFICFSPEWTPPHLRPQYKDLCRSVEHLEHI